MQIKNDHIINMMAISFFDAHHSIQVRIVDEIPHSSLFNIRARHSNAHEFVI